MMDLNALSAPFPPTDIDWRLGGENGERSRGLALPFLTARQIMDRLDQVCGPENWQDRYEFHGSRTVCYLSLCISGEWVTKADGAGDSSVEAEKGAISDALKRAAVKWGIGRYLYQLGTVWVELEGNGKTRQIKHSEFVRLDSMLQHRFGDPRAIAAQANSLNSAGVDLQYAQIQNMLRIAAKAGLTELATQWRRVQADLKGLTLEQRRQLFTLKEQLKAYLCQAPKPRPVTPAMVHGGAWPPPYVWRSPVFVQQPS